MPVWIRSALSVWSKLIYIFAIADIVVLCIYSAYSYFYKGDILIEALSALFMIVFVAILPVYLHFVRDEFRKDMAKGTPPGFYFEVQYVFVGYLLPSVFVFGGVMIPFT